MKLNQKYLIVICLLLALTNVASFKKTKSHFQNRTRVLEKIALIQPKHNTTRVAPASISNNSTVELSRNITKSTKTRENLWDDFLKSGLEDGVIESERSEKSNYCIGSKISSHKHDDDKFHINARLCKGNWHFYFDHEGNLYLENIYCSILIF